MSMHHCQHCGVLHDTDFNAEHEDECERNPENVEEMSDSEMWAEHKKATQEKKANNTQQSLALLSQRGFTYQILNESVRHYRVKGWDFWPSTGKFYNPKTGQKGRGVFNLIKRLNQKTKT